MFSYLKYLFLDILIKVRKVKCNKFVIDVLVYKVYVVNFVILIVVYSKWIV